MISDIKKAILRISEQEGIHPSMITVATFNKHLTDEERETFTPHELKKLGGVTGIAKAEFPFDDYDHAELKNQKDNKSYQNKLERQLQNKLSFQKNLLKSVKDVVKPINYNPYRRTPTKRVRKTSENVFMLNDTHIGAIVKPEEIGGLNTFDFLQASRRIARYIQEAVNYRLEDRDRTKKAHLILNGDLIAGVIHDLEAKQVHLMTHQCNAAIHIFTHCIAHLVKVYQEVEVHCLPGNHERFLHKNHGKRPMTEHFDSFSGIIFFALSAIFQKEKNVKFKTPHEPYAFLDLPGGRGLVTHGHSLFSTSLKNPSRTLNVKLLNDDIERFSIAEMHKGNKKIDLVLFGHVHHYTHFVTSHGTHVCIAASPMGIDGFAHSIGINQNTATQVGFYSDCEGVFKSPMIVDLTDADSDESLDDIIPPYELELTWRSNG